MSTVLDVPAAAKAAVVAAEAGDRVGGRQVTTENVYVVWSVKVLGNWKALVSTDLEAGFYWEVTHNGNSGETYVDLYRKSRNTTVRDL